MRRPTGRGHRRGAGSEGIGGRTPAGRPPGSAWRCWLPRPRSAAAWSRAPTSTRGSFRSTCPRQQPGLATASRPALWVQVAFAVVMVREGVWATVLEDQAAAVGAGFPQWAQAARSAAEQGQRPVADAGVVRELLDGFGRWAEDELDQAVSEASNLDGQGR